jgi:hypothetical protein
MVVLLEMHVVAYYSCSLCMFLVSLLLPLHIYGRLAFTGMWNHVVSSADTDRLQELVYGPAASHWSQLTGSSGPLTDLVTLWTNVNS